MQGGTRLRSIIQVEVCSQKTYCGINVLIVYGIFQVLFAGELVIMPLVDSSV